MRSFYGALFLLLTVLWPSHARAGAWLLDKKQVQYISTTSYSTASSQFDRSGRVVRDIDFSKIDTTIFAEYGLAKNWTIGGKASLQDIDLSSAQTDLSFVEIGPFELWARKRLWQGEKAVVSAQVTGAFEGRFSDNFGDQIADGTFAIEARILAGRSVKIGPNYGFIEGQFAYYARESDGIDELRADLTIGYNLSRSFEWINQAFWTETTGTSQDALDYRRLKAQSALHFKRSDSKSYQIGILRTLTGRNSLRETGVFIGTTGRF